MDDPGGTCPSARPSLISGLEIPESFDYEVSLKSLDLAGFLIALEHDVPAEDDDQQPENPIVLIRDSPIPTKEESRVLSDHRPQQRQRHIRVMPRSQSRQFHH